MTIAVPPFASWSFTAGFELALGDVLEVAVDRQLERRAGNGRHLDARLHGLLGAVPLDQRIHRAAPPT